KTLFFLKQALFQEQDFRALRLDLLIEVSLRLHEEILGLEFGLARPSVGLFLGSMDDSSGTIFSVPKSGRDDPPLDHPEHPCANRGSHRDCYDDDRQIRNGRLPTMAMRASSPHHGVNRKLSVGEVRNRRRVRNSNLRLTL